GKLVLIADTKAMLLSSDIAEVNGKNKTIVASNKSVQLVAKYNLLGMTSATLDASSTGDMTIVSGTKLKVQVDGDKAAGVCRQDGVLEVLTTPDQSLKLDQGAKKTTLKGYETLELSASKIARILAGGSGDPSFVMDGDQGKLTGKSGDWQLDL